MVKFTTEVLLARKTATGIEVPEAVLAALGSSRRPAVTVSLGGYSYRSTVGSMGGKFMLPISADIRAATGIKAGDVLEVELENDDAPREVTVPDDLVAALAADEEARAVFDGYAYGHKLRHVLAVEDAKTPETRQRRIAKAIEMLKAGK